MILRGVWNTCPVCGSRLKRKRTKPVTSCMRYVYTECSNAECRRRDQIIEEKPQSRKVRPSHPLA